MYYGVFGMTDISYESDLIARWWTEAVFVSAISHHSGAERHIR